MARRTYTSSAFINGPSPAPNKPKPAEEEKKEKAVSITPEKKTGSGSRTTPTLALPRVETGVALPWWIGRTRVVAPNAIWGGPITTEVTFTTQYHPVTGAAYQAVTRVDGADVQFALGHGPEARLRAIYVGDKVVWSGDEGPDPTEVDVIENTALFGPVTFYGGQFDQPANDDMTDVSPEVVSSYPGVCYAFCKYVKQTITDSALTFEVERHPNPLGLDSDVNVAASGDINYMTAAYDILTSRWGGAGMDPAKINEASFVAAAIKLAAEGNFGSFNMQEDQPITTIIGTIEEVTDCVFFYNPGTGLVEVRITRRGDYDRTANYPKFDHKNIVSFKQFNKESGHTAVTEVIATFTDRLNSYKPGSVMVQNLAILSDVASKTEKITINFPTVHDAEIARDLAVRELALRSAPMFVCEIEVHRTGADVLPGDIAVITWPRANAWRIPVRVTKQRKMDLHTNTVMLTCEQLITPNDDIAFTPPDVPLIVVDDTPYPPLELMLIDAPAVLTGLKNPVMDTTSIAHAQVRAPGSTYSMPFVLAKPYNAFQQSAVGTRSWGGGNFRDVPPFNTGYGFKYANHGELKVAIGKYDGFDTGFISEIELKNFDFRQRLKNQNADYVRAKAFLVFIDDEILGYETFTFTATPKEIILHTVYRGLVDTVAQDHAIDADVWIFDASNDPLRSPAFKYNTNTPSSEIWAEGQVPIFRFHGRAGGEISTTYLQYNDWTSHPRASLPVRPHDTRIEGLRLGPVEFPMFPGGSFDITWKTRRSKTADQSFAGWFLVPQQTVEHEIALQTDAAQDPEVWVLAEPNDLLGTYAPNTQEHIVRFKDSANVVTDLGTIEGNALTVVIPTGAAEGSGELWVVAKTVDESRYLDKLPVYVYHDMIIEEDEDFLITEDDLFYVELE